jgi:hypothetical protein
MTKKQVGHSPRHWTTGQLDDEQVVLDAPSREPKNDRRVGKWQLDQVPVTPQRQTNLCGSLDKFHGALREHGSKKKHMPSSSVCPRD